jgi:hypothetical protein
MPERLKGFEFKVKNKKAGAASAFLFFLAAFRVIIETKGK